MSQGSVGEWVLLAVVLLLAVLAWVLLSRRNAALPVDPGTSELVRGRGGTESPGRVWVIANPSKFDDFETFKAAVAARVLGETGHLPAFLETTVEDPGVGQAIEALRHEPSLVIAAGGDGTVRAVAAGVAHSGVPMAVLPCGTGNLLARNLSIPLDLDAALAVALDRDQRTLDLAWLRMERVSEPPDLPAEGALLGAARAGEVRELPDGLVEPRDDEFAYVVIAGVGFDGQTMADTSPEMKKTIGWPAYFLAALKSLFITRMRATVTIFHEPGQAPPSPGLRRTGRVPQAVEAAVRQSHTLGAQRSAAPAVERDENWDMTAVRARTVLFANCGVLPFAVLAPDAVLDDGLLDVIAIDTRGGLVGWAYLGVKVMGQSVGLLPVNVKNDWGTIQFRQTHEARVDMDSPYPVQIDGDPVGSARTVIVRACKGALEIRVPSGTLES